MADGILNPIEQLEAEIDFDVYTKQEVDALLDEKADKSDTYTKTETDALLDDKADADSVYTKTETDTLLSAKADKSTTLAGYGITDAYSKTQTDNLLNGKADADSVYTKTEIDTKIPNTVGSATKPTYVNGGVITECTYELNKTVPANAVFTDTTYTAGNGLNLIGTSFSAKAGANVSVDSGGINVNGNGVVASADSGLVSGGTAYTELRPTLDGTWVKNAQTTAINLQKLEGGIEYLYGLLSHQYDQLKKYINGNYYDYDTDTDSKYTKTVPNGAMPYASLDSIGGKTLVWKQLCGDTNATQFVTKVTDGHYVVNGTPAYYTPSFIDENGNVIKSVSGHKYFVRFDCDAVNIVLFSGTTVLANSSVSLTNSSIITINSEGNLVFRVGNSSGTTTYTNCNVYVTIVDLTLCYGAGNEPSTVDEFTAQFPASYYPYNAGTLLSAGVTEVVSKGKNLCDGSAVLGAISSNIPYIVSSTEITSPYSITTNYMGALFCFNVEAGKTYTLSSVQSAGFNNNFYWAIYNSLAEATSRANAIEDGRTTDVFTPTKKGVCVFMKIYLAGATATWSNVQAEVGSTATSYSPYHAPIQYPIPAEVQALEGYGWSAGSVYNYIDFERKVFVQNVAEYTVTGQENWSYQNSRFILNTLPVLRDNSRTSVLVVSNIYVGTNTDYRDSISGIAKVIGENNQIAIYDPTYTDTTAFKTRLQALYSANTPLIIHYALATPIETDISAYLTDDNLIEVEAGGTLTFPNSNGDDYRMNVPSSETFMVDLQSALGE